MRYDILTTVYMSKLVLWVVMYGSALKLEAVCSSDTLISTYKPTRQ